MFGCFGFGGIFLFMGWKFFFCLFIFVGFGGLVDYFIVDFEVVKVIDGDILE